MLSLKFHSKINNQSTAICVDESSVTMNEIMTKIKEHYRLAIDTDINIYCISKDIKPIYFKNNLDIDNMFIMSKEIRYFEVFWKQTEHGKQELDNSKLNMHTTDHKFRAHTHIPHT